MEAVEVMTARNIGSIMVMEEGALLGLFTERDLMKRVVAEKKDTASVLVSDVMTTELVTIKTTDSIMDAMTLMNKHHIRHVPIMNPDGSPDSLLTMRNIQSFRLEQLRQENETLSALALHDGPGG